MYKINNFQKIAKVLRTLMEKLLRNIYLKSQVDRVKIEWFMSSPSFKNMVSRKTLANRHFLFPSNFFLYSNTCTV